MRDPLRKQGLQCYVCGEMREPRGYALIKEVQPGAKTGIGHMRQTAMLSRASIWKWTTTWGKRGPRLSLASMS